MQRGCWLNLSGAGSRRRRPLMRSLRPITSAAAPSRRRAGHELEACRARRTRNAIQRTWQLRRPCRCHAENPRNRERQEWVAIFPRVCRSDAQTIGCRSVVPSRIPVTDTLLSFDKERALTAALPVPAARSGQIAPLDQLAAIPEEEIWLAKQKSPQTRRAYRLDVRHFMLALHISNTDQLHQVDHRAVIAWERMQREQEGAAASTIRRRLAALSSLFKHLVKHGAASRNPVVDVDRPTINREEGSTAAFSKAQARKLLDAPPADTIAGLRDRAILS